MGLKMRCAALRIGLLAASAIATGAYAEDWVVGSPAVLCSDAKLIAELLRYTAENKRQDVSRLYQRGCQALDVGSPVRILSRDHANARVAVGSAGTERIGYMPLQSIVNSRGDPIE